MLDYFKYQKLGESFSTKDVVKKLNKKLVKREKNTAPFSHKIANLKKNSNQTKKESSKIDPAEAICGIPSTKRSRSTSPQLPPLKKKKKKNFWN